MKKGILLLSVVAAIATDITADGLTETEELKKQIESLEKKVKINKKKANDAKKLANGNHLKFDVDFRTAYDMLDYKLADGTHAKNNSLISNKLLINMKYDAGDNIRFYGTLAFNKAFGQTLSNDMSNYYTFDWVTNEALSDDTIKLKEAYWLYANDTFFGLNMPWTASIGRRPSTNGWVQTLEKVTKENQL
jgi:hypothetical protein